MTNGIEDKIKLGDFDSVHDNEFSKFKPILEERYNLCDKDGHKKPDYRKNECTYCYRHMTYRTRADNILEERNGLTLMKQPIDAPVLMELDRQDMAHYHFLDLMNGVSKLEQELKIADLKKLKEELDKADIFY